MKAKIILVLCFLLSTMYFFSQPASQSDVYLTDDNFIANHTYIPFTISADVASIFSKNDATIILNQFGERQSHSFHEIYDYIDYGIKHQSQSKTEHISIGALAKEEKEDEFFVYAIKSLGYKNIYISYFYNLDEPLPFKSLTIDNKEEDSKCYSAFIEKVKELNRELCLSAIIKTGKFLIIALFNQSKFI